MRIIDRNAGIDATHAGDPRLVRQALDMIANPPVEFTRSSEIPAVNQRGKKAANKRSKSKSDPVPDPKKNPDLDELSRTSPEAAFDLFRLIKQAGRRLL